MTVPIKQMCRGESAALEGELWMLIVVSRNRRNWDFWSVPREHQPASVLKWGETLGLSVGILSVSLCRIAYRNQPWVLCNQELKPLLQADHPRTASVGFYYPHWKHGAPSHPKTRILAWLLLKSALVSLLFYFPSSNKIKGWFKNIIPQTREILKTETLLGEGTFIRQLRELRVINYMLQESGSVSRTLLCVTKQANQGSKRSVIVRPKGSHSPLSTPYSPCNT